MSDKKTSALLNQVGGAHYKNLRIQPVEFCEINGLTSCQSSIVRYITRHKSKNGRVDIEKAIHYAELMIQLRSPRWILDLPLVKSNLLQRYALRWTTWRGFNLGESIEARKNRKWPVLLPLVYTTSNGMEIEESNTISLICYSPGLAQVQRAIGIMREIIQRDYPCSDSQ